MVCVGRATVVLVVLCTVLQVAALSASASLVANGGFELPVNGQEIVFHYPASQGLTSWTITSDRADVLSSSGSAHSGSQLLQFSLNWPAVWQRLAVTPGSVYSFTWWQSSNTAGVGSVTVSWCNGVTGAAVQSVTTSDSTWTSHAMTVTAQTADDYIVIRRSGMGYPWIDDVSVHAYDASSAAVAAAKLSADGTSVGVIGFATAAFPSFFYVESADRSSGIRVAKPSHGVSPGCEVLVLGSISTTGDRERCILADTVVATGGVGEVLPLGISNKALGGSAWMYAPSGTVGQSGVVGGYGLNNIGLLVRVFGEVTSVGSGFFYVDDGSGVKDSSGRTGVRVYADGLALPTVGDFACVTGVSTCFVESGVGYRAVRARLQEDLIVNGRSTGATIQISCSAASVGVGRTVKVTAIATQATGAPMVGVQLWPYVNDLQWGSPEVTDAQGRATFLIPLPNPGVAAIQVKDKALVPFSQFPVGKPSPPYCRASNVVPVHVGNRAIEMPIDPNRLVGMEYEPWQVSQNFNFAWWTTSESVPLVGYYNSFNADAIRQHAIWMSEAGVNFVMIDWVFYILGKQHWSEREPYIDELVNSTTNMLNVYAEMLAEGIPVPKIVLMPGLDNGAPTTTGAINECLDWIQTNYVSNPRYNGLWLDVEGKPLVIVFNGGGPANLAGQPPIDTTRFTIRYMSHQLQMRDPSAFAGYWSWMDGVVAPIPVYNVNAPPDAYWIWNSPTADNQTVYLRKSFTLAEPATRASIKITCDDSYSAYLNGHLISTGAGWPQVQCVTGLERHLVTGANVLAVRGANGVSPAGLIARLDIAAGQSSQAVMTDASWRSSTQQPTGWPNVGMDQGPPVAVIAPLGQGAWGALPAWQRPVEALTLATGYFGGGGWLGAGAVGRRGGTTYVEEFKTALQYRPQYLILHQWNEFAGQVEGTTSFYGDSYNVELSTDMEPTSLTACGYRGCGGWGMYYLNLTRAMVAMYRQDTPEDTVLAVASPLQGQTVTGANMQVSWSAIGAPALSYTILLDGQPAAQGIHGTTYTVSLAGVANGLHTLTLIAEGALTHYALAYDREDDRLAEAVPAKAEVGFNLQRP